ncbi:MAG: HAD-IA family hydrolase [bacterium]|nr:HAD-IA family hydrolase [bacterium]
MSLVQIEIDSRAKALIFDIDGTLADTMPIHFLAWQEAVKGYNFDFTEELFYNLAGYPTIKIIPLLNERFGCTMALEEIMLLKEKAFLEKLDLVKPIEPVVDLVYRSHGNMPISLGTGGRRIIAERIIRIIGLDKFFSIMVAAEDVENHKPAPDTFLKCAELMNIEPRYCQVFEDGDPGLEAARTAGMIPTDVRGR